MACGACTLENLSRCDGLFGCGEFFFQERLDIHALTTELTHQVAQLAHQSALVRASRSLLLIFDFLMQDEPNQPTNTMRQDPGGPFAFQPGL